MWLFLASCNWVLFLHFVQHVSLLGWYVRFYLFTQIIIVYISKRFYQHQPTNMYYLWKSRKSPSCTLCTLCNLSILVQLGAHVVHTALIIYHELLYIFNKAFKILLIQLSMYLFHMLVHICFLLISWLSNTLLKLNTSGSKWLFIKYSHLSIGITEHQLLFLLELAYSHLVVFRLFLGFMDINPVFLFISLCIYLVLGINSFYYEYSIFALT